MVAPVNFEVDERYYFEIASILITTWMVGVGLIFWGVVSGFLLIVVGYVLAFSKIRSIQEIRLTLVSWSRAFVIGGLVSVTLAVFDVNFRATSGAEISSLGVALYSAIHFPAYLAVYFYYWVRLR